MPLYDYRCTKCGHQAEIRHGFNDTYANPCPVCGAPMARVFNPAPIVFKGSGFYVTDSRPKSSSSDGGSSSSSSSSAPASTSNGGSDSKPSGGSESAA